ncbi:MAG TPA: response regulator, partial [Polyangia bacterium]|nr:response regulator [Polyangia bacterium]
PERRVLVVDDEPRARALLVQCLSAASWRVQTADRCGQAQLIAQTFVPAFLVAEQRLADGTGFELFTRLRAINPALKAIMVTRHASIASAVDAVRNGFEDYLAKPVEPQRVAERLDQRATRDERTDVFEHVGKLPSLAHVEWEHINATLYGCDGNVSEAARLLGLHRRSLQRKLRRHEPAVGSNPARP